jgi:hypothetical protein
MAVNGSKIEMGKEREHSLRNEYVPTHHDLLLQVIRELILYCRMIRTVPSRQRAKQCIESPAYNQQRRLLVTISAANGPLQLVLSTRYQHELRCVHLRSHLLLQAGIGLPRHGASYTIANHCECCAQRIVT